jgi:predicted alpha/beta superfamily hydrolase
MRSPKVAAYLTVVAAIVISTASCQDSPPPPPPPLESEVDIVLGESIPLESEIYGESRTVNVFLPMGYAERNERFPVLYLIDGGVRQDFIPMAGMAALATLSGQYREFILVGIQTNNRHYELTSRSEVEYDLENIPKNGGADDFRRHLINEVKPFIEDRYRTSGEDAIIGESLAGLFIAETFLRAPKSFDHYVAVSPSLWWRNMGLSREAIGLLQRDGFPADRSLYLTIADEGGTMIEGMERLVKALESNAPEGLDWWYEPMLDEEHHTIYNPAALHALRLVFAPR